MSIFQRFPLDFDFMQNLRRCLVEWSIFISDFNKFWTFSTPSKNLISKVTVVRRSINWASQASCWWWQGKPNVNFAPNLTYHSPVKLQLILFSVRLVVQPLQIVGYRFRLKGETGINCNRVGRITIAITLRSVIASRCIECRALLRFIIFLGCAVTQLKGNSKTFSV